ncbi:MAG TPA: F0F1 ATP synthase subunit alpha, partial [Pseudothermotoga sp.]|nr:F0F1 ATP synthase subunit alpha [Pseudothermotoga sp.]
MRISPGEITKVLEDRIKEFKEEIDLQETGRVVQIGDGIARVYGLNSVMADELVEFVETGVKGLAFNLEEDNVGVILLGPYSQIKEGHIVKRLKKIIEVPVGEELLGRVVNPLGEPLDGLGPVEAKHTRK